MIIRETPQFQRSRGSLPPAIQRTLIGKLALLAHNPRHPSLRTHRVFRAEGPIWESRLSHTHRVVYHWQGDQITLLDVGGHEVVDRVHLRKL